MPGKTAAENAGRTLGLLGGSKGGLASAAALSRKARSVRARAAVTARWVRWRAENPLSGLRDSDRALLDQITSSRDKTWYVEYRPKFHSKNAREYRAALRLEARGLVVFVSRVEVEGVVTLRVRRA